MITIDDRIGSKDLAAYITAPHRLGHLEFADVAWVGNGPDDAPVGIGVERKRLRDLLNSMESGRLANHQLIGMSNAYHYLYVVVEGIWRTNQQTGLLEVPRGKGVWKPLTLGSSRTFTSAVIDNFTNALACQLSVTVVFCPTPWRTGQWISNIYRWWTNKKWCQHRSTCGVSTPEAIIVGMRKKAPIVAQMAAKLRGVGADKARKLAAAFGSPLELCCATVEDLMQVDSVGKTIAEGIYRQLREED